MIEYITGNLFDTDCDIIAHGVNCRNAFGSGVAGQIAKLYPEVKEAYHKKYEDKGWKLGDVQYVNAILKHDKVFANCATQDDFGYSGKCLADYDAIESCFEELLEMCELSRFSLAMPWIGCGLAAGNKTVVKQILEDVFKDSDVTVKVYTLEEG